MSPPAVPVAPAAPALEQPLPAARHGLFLFVATLLISAFYLFSALFLVFGSVLWIALTLLAILFSYYGMPLGWPVVHALGASLKAFARGLRLGRGVDFHLVLKREQAPQLWQIVEDLSARLSVAPPHEYVLESGTNAYVMLRGLAAGRGKTRLGVGFDLLAGLSEAQARAVMAHEIAHAKYVRRGYQGFLMRGLFRLGRCAGAIEAMRDHDDNHKLARFTARVIGALPNYLSKTAGKLVAACSRYDEFLADRIAAEICGAAPCHSALLAVQVVGHQSDKIGYRERLLHLDREPGYEVWLRERLQLPDDAKRLELEARALDRAQRHELSTHPALPDRLAAIDAVTAPPDVASRADELNGESGLSWFTDAGEAGAQLLRHIEQTAAAQEAKATQSLAKWMRKRERGQSREALLNNEKVWAFGLAILAVVFARVWWNFAHDLLLPDENADALTTWLMIAGVAILPVGAGAAAVYLAVKSPKRAGELPIPPFALFQQTRLQQRDRQRAENEKTDAAKSKTDEQKRADKAREEEREAQCNIARGAALRAQTPTDLGKPEDLARFHVAQGYEALSRGDIAAAAHCARLVCEIDPNRDEATLIRRVCAASRGWRGLNNAHTKQLADKHGIGGRWALAWIACAENQTQIAEAMLLELTRARPKNATIRALLGHCQMRNGKPREALASRKLALELCQNAPATALASMHVPATEAAPDLADCEQAAHRFALAYNLVALGQLSEARAELDWLGEHRGRREEAGQTLIGLDARELDLEELKWHIARGQSEKSLQLAGAIAADSATAQTNLEVADALAQSSEPELLNAAQLYYERALAIGYYPRAKFAIAGLYFERDEKARARGLLLESLDARIERPSDASHPLSLLDNVISGVRAIDDARPEKVAAWEIALDAKDLKLDIARLFLLCLAPDEAGARALAQEIFEALLPAQDWGARIAATRAPTQYQPDEPAPPGIYGSRWEE